ncbi:MAG: shikimate kinase [Mariprofundaceae bacterium]
MISLVGLMGSGKTTIGRLLAARLRCPFEDLDEAIVARAGKPIPRIFAEDGECVFRAIEGEALEGVVRRGGYRVLATGGGVVLRAPNRARLKRAGPVIWLDAPPEVLAARIAGDPNRPLLHGVDPLARMRELDRARRALYREVADLRIDVGRLAPDAAVDAIAAFLSESGA